MYIAESEVRKNARNKRGEQPIQVQGVPLVQNGEISSHMIGRNRQTDAYGGKRPRCILSFSCILSNLHLGFEKYLNVADIIHACGRFQWAEFPHLSSFQRRICPKIPSMFQSPNKV